MGEVSGVGKFFWECSWVPDHFSLKQEPAAQTLQMDADYWPNQGPALTLVFAEIFSFFSSFWILLHYLRCGWSKSHSARSCEPCCLLGFSLFMDLNADGPTHAR